MPEPMLYEGRVVPWVTQWSEEQDAVDNHPYECAGTYRIKGMDMQVVKEPRQLHGRGEPQFARVNSRRQQRSATRGNCQVCGTTPEDRRMEQFWCVPTEGKPGEFVPDKTFFGAEMPVCPDCVPVAIANCPHLAVADRLWVLGQYDGIVGALVSPAPNIRESMFLRAENFERNPDWFVKQWIIRVYITSVIGTHENILNMLNREDG